MSWMSAWLDQGDSTFTEGSAPRIRDLQRDRGAIRKGALRLGGVPLPASSVRSGNGGKHRSHEDNRQNQRYYSLHRILLPGINAEHAKLFSRAFR